MKIAIRKTVFGVTALRAQDMSAAGYPHLTAIILGLILGVYYLFSYPKKTMDVRL